MKQLNLAFLFVVLLFPFVLMGQCAFGDAPPRLEELLINFDKFSTTRLQKELNDYLEKNRPDFHTHHFQAEIYLKDKQYEAVVASCRKAIDNCRDNYRTWMILGISEFALAQYTTAISDFDAAIVILDGMERTSQVDRYDQKNRELIFSYLARIGIATANYGQGLNAIEHALALDPNRPWYYLMRGDLYESSGELLLALPDYNEAIRLKDDYAEAYFYRARYYWDRGKFDLARTDFQKLMELSPNESKHVLEYATFLQSQEQYAEALKLAMKAVRLGGEDLNAVYRRCGSIYLEMNEFEKAIEQYQNAIAVNHDDYNAMMDITIAKTGLGDTTGALQDFSKILQNFPEKPRVWVSYSYLLTSCRRYAESIIACNKAIELDTLRITAYHNRAYNYYKLEQWEAAMGDLEFLLEQDSLDVSYIGFRGSVNHGLGLHELALADFAKVLQIQPDRHITIFERSKTYEFLKQYDLALADCEAALKLDPENAEYKAAIVRIQEKQSQK